MTFFAVWSMPPRLHVLIDGVNFYKTSVSSISVRPHSPTITNRNRHNHACKHTHACAVHTHLPHQWVNVKEACYYSVSPHIKWTIPFNKHTWDLTAMHENCCLHWIFITKWNKLKCFPPLIIVILAAKQRWVQRCKKESSNKTEVIEVWGKKLSLKTWRWDGANTTRETPKWGCGTALSKKS